MTHHTTEGSLSITLEMATAADRAAYLSKTPMEQHGIKSYFITQLRTVTDDLVPLMETWIDLEIAVDSMYHQSIPAMPDLISGELTKANALLEDVTLSVGAPATAMVCAKTFDCGHICWHSYQLVKEDSSGSNVWTISKDGITVQVTAALEWITPPSS